MGKFKVAARVTHPAEPGRFFEEDFRGDTGTLYCFVTEDLLDGIGLAPVHSRELVMADGRATGDLRERRC